MTTLKIKLIYMNKSSCTFSRKMLKFVQDKKLDYIFAGKDGQVLSTSNMLLLLLEMNNSEMVWKNLNGNLHEQEKAIKKKLESTFSNMGSLLIMNPTENTST